MFTNITFFINAKSKYKFFLKKFITHLENILISNPANHINLVKISVQGTSPNKS